MTYHCFLPEDSDSRRYVQSGMVISPKVFAGQLEFLKRKFTIIPLETLAEALKSGTAVPAKALALTVDDGWRDNYIYAFPIIKKHGVPLTIFLTADYIGGDRPLWFYRAKKIIADSGVSRARLEQYLNRYDKAGARDVSRHSPISDYAAGDKDPADWFIGRLKELKPSIIDSLLQEVAEDAGIAESELSGESMMMTWAELREMAAAGVDFGSHGCTHRILTNLPKEEIEWELVESKNKIRENLGIEVKAFSYPNGDFDSLVLGMTARADYSYAVCTHGKGGADIRESKSIGRGAYAIRRISMHDNAVKSPFGGFSPALFYYHLIRNI